MKGECFDLTGDGASGDEGDVAGDGLRGFAGGELPGNKRVGEKRVRTNKEWERKRSGFDEECAAVKLVVGNALNDGEVLKLLSLTSYCVADAINLYLDKGKKVLGGGNQGWGSLKNEPKIDLKKKDPGKDGWPKLLASLILEAESTTRMDAEEVSYSLPCNADLIVHLQDGVPARDGPKPVPPKKKGKMSTFGNRKPQQTMIRLNVKYCNRFGKRVESSIGRLPKSISGLVYPLLKHKLVNIAVRLAGPAPSSLTPFTRILVKVDISVASKKVFDHFPDPTSMVNSAEDELGLSFFNLTQLIHNPHSFEIISLGSNTTVQEDQGHAKEMSQKDAEDLMKADCEKQLGIAEDPEGLTITLRRHQKIALSWMLEREGQVNKSQSNPLWTTYCFKDKESTKYYVNAYLRMVSLKLPPSEPLRGGILGDEMGLGKTICVLALLLASKGLGNESISDDDNAAKFGKSTLGRGQTLVVCPTSLVGQWVSEFASKIDDDHCMRVLPFHGNDRAKLIDFKSYDCVITTYGVVASEFSRESSCMFNTQWHRVILDEAHVIKNRNTDSAKAVASLRSTCRFCLTGTPIQNTCDDLFSLLYFLRHEPWNSYTWWSKIIRLPYESDNAETSKQGLRRLRALLNDGPLLLRRTKKQLDDWELKNPEESKKQRLPEKTISILSIEFSEAERTFYDGLYSRSKAEFDGLVASGSARTKYAAILTLLLRLRQACDHPFLVLMTQEDATQTTDAKLVDPRVESLKKNLCGQQSSKFLETTLKGKKGRECPICLDPPDEATITQCGHVMCKACLVQSVRYNGLDSTPYCPVCRVEISMKLATPFTMDPVVNGVITLSGEVIQSRQKLVDNHWKSSSKLTTLADHIRKIMAFNVTLQTKDASPDDKLVKFYLGDTKPTKKPVKVLIYSQFTKMLNLVEESLKKIDVNFVRLDGSMTQTKRQNSIATFDSDSNVNVFIISFKAGGVGLNLTSASVMFCLDPWWNPSLEKQLHDRVHRIGQTRPVHIYRLIAKDTVEERIVALQERKSSMANEVLSDGINGDLIPVQNNNKLSLQDLKDLFR